MDPLMPYLDNTGRCTCDPGYVCEVCRAMQETVDDTGQKREFSTGASRDTGQGKLDYEGFESPLVMQRYALYMHKHRHLRDGSLRSSDNWQKGIPLDVYMKSLWRHFMEVWSLHRGWPVERPEDPDFVPDMLEALCAIRFNVNGMMHELLKKDLEDT